MKKYKVVFNDDSEVFVAADDMWLFDVDGGCRLEFRDDSGDLVLVVPPGGWKFVAVVEDQGQGCQ